MQTDLLSGVQPRKKGDTRRPTLILLSITAAYLLLELAFSARLLDAAGGMATFEEIKAIEHWGRTLSGFAVALFVWGWILKRDWHTALKALAMAAAVGAAVPGMFAAQDALIRSVVDQTDGRQRRDAAFLVMATRFMLSGHLTLAGLELPQDTWRSPDAKAFIAAFPLLASDLKGLDQVADDIVRSTLRGHMTSGCTPGADGCLGSFSDFNNDLWRGLISEVNSTYKAYADGVNRYADALQKTPEEQENAWGHYTARLAERNYRPGTVPRMGWSRVRKDVQGQGIPVDNDWRPDDRAGFNAAVATVVRRRADTAYDTELRRQLGTALPKNLSVASFMAHPEIQKRLHDRLGTAGLGVSLPYLIQPEEVERRVYQPLLTAAVDRQVRTLTAPASDFARGGRYARLGLTSAERLVVPPLALAFSLLGGLTHTLKCLYLGLFLLTGRRWPGGVAIGGVLPAAIVGGLLADSPLTRSPVYLTLEKQVRDARGPVIAGGVRWMVQVERFAYPVNEALRRSVLLGLTYGFQPVPLPPPPDGTARLIEAGTGSQPQTPPQTPPSAAAGQALTCGSEVQAHRGGRPFPENTAAAIRAAARAGFPTAEIDVQPLSDGGWALHHDAVTGRAVSGPRRPAATVTTAQWQALRALDGAGRDAGPASVLEDAIDAANSAGIRLHIEVKAPVSCRQIDGLLDRAAALRQPPYWSTAFPAVARCLAARQVDYLGLVVGPADPGSAPATAAAKAAAIAGSLGLDTPRLRAAAADAYDAGTNRTALDDTGMAAAAAPLTGARQRGLHIPHTDLSPALMTRASGLGLSVGVYAAGGDDRGMADTLRRMPGQGPAFIITDATPALFCP